MPQYLRNQDGCLPVLPFHATLSPLCQPDAPFGDIIAQPEQARASELLEAVSNLVGLVGPLQKGKIS